MVGAALAEQVLSKVYDHIAVHSIQDVFEHSHHLHCIIEEVLLPLVPLIVPDGDGNPDGVLWVIEVLLELLIQPTHQLVHYHPQAVHSAPGDHEYQAFDRFLVPSVPSQVAVSCPFEVRVPDHQLDRISSVAALVGTYMVLSSELYVSTPRGFITSGTTSLGYPHSSP